MMLDYDSSRAWADHGRAWSELAGKVIDSGIEATVRRFAAALPRLASAVAAVAVTLAFVGVAVLPGLADGRFF